MELLVPSCAAIRAHLLPFRSHIAAGKTLALLAVSSCRFPRGPRKTLSVVHASSPSLSFLSSSAAEAAEPPCRGWIVVVEKPRSVGSARKEVIDYYVETLARVLGNEEAQMCIYDASWHTHFVFCCDTDEEAQMCIYDASWHTHFVFCCDTDEKASHELARDGEVDSPGKDQIPNIKTKRLFVTGLSFYYTSEKTLCAAFEGYGELVEVKIIMDKISKMSKGYAFIEYTVHHRRSCECSFERNEWEDH